MRGVYTAEIEIASVSTAQTVLFIGAPGDTVVEILSAAITNMDNDTAEQLESGLFYVSDTTNVVGTSVTPEKHETGDTNSTILASGNLTTEPSGYNTKGIDRQGYNNLAGYRYDPIPEEKPVLSPGQHVGLRMLTAPSTGFKAVASIVFREIGG